MICRDMIYSLLEERGQNPKYNEKYDTLIETDTAGVFYVLEYNGNDWVGWSVSDGVIDLMKHYQKRSILFINSQEVEMFLVLESNQEFQAYLNKNKSPYKINRSLVKDCLISYESLDYYLQELE